MKKIFHLSRLLYVVTTILYIHTAQAQIRPAKHQKKLRLSQPPAFVKGVVLIKFTKTYESLLASRGANVNKFGIDKLDSVLQTLKVRSIRQEFAMLFEPGFNTRSARDANRTLSAKRKPLITAEILDQRHKEFGFHLWYRLQFDSSTYIRAVLDKLHSLKGIIDIAEPLSVPKAASFDDPFYQYQYSLNNTGQGGGKPGADIKAKQAWTITTGDTNVVVAVTDMGIKTDHEDLAESMWFGKGYNFVDGSPAIIPGDHGTHVAGIIAARNNNGKGISGIAGGNGSPASGARIMSCMISNPDNTYSGNRAAAFVYAADNGAAISNNSYGSYSSGDYKELIFIDAVRYFSKYGGGAATKGGLTVWGAGNSNLTIPFAISSYDVDNTIRVAATDNTDKKAPYSNYGDFIDISAPGSNVLSTVANPVNGYMYDYYNGTSMAAPTVSGVAALVASVAPGRFTADEVSGIVLSTADNIDTLNPGYEGKLGSGRVNAYRAVLKAQQIATLPVLDTVGNATVSRTCNGYNVAYTKNAAGNDVMIALGLTRRFNFPEGQVYKVGDSIGKEAKVVYRGAASSFAITQILKDSAIHYFKIWSVNGSHYSGGRVLIADSSFHTIRNPSFTAGVSSVAIHFGKVCPNSDVIVVVNSLPQFGKPRGILNAGNTVAGGGTVLYKGSADGFTHSGLSSGTYYYALYPVIDTTYGLGRFSGGYCFGSTAAPLPLKASFEEPEVPANLALFTPSQNGLGWDISNSGTGRTGKGYAFTRNFYNYNPAYWGEASYVQTGSMDVVGADSIICRFAHAYPIIDSSIFQIYGTDYHLYSDTLSVIISADCGQTWQTAWEKWGYGLSTMQANVDFQFATEPQTPADWVNNKINLTGLLPAGTGSIMVAFKSSNRSLHNIYLDDINIYKVLHNDAGIAAVLLPAADACSSTLSPRVALTNFGINPLSSANIYYKIDSGTVQSFAWSGNKVYEQSDTVTLPAFTAAAGSHTLTVYTTLPNAQTDVITANDTVYTPFRVLKPIVLAANAESAESFESPAFVPDQWRLADSVKPNSWVRISPDVAPGFVAASDTSAAFVNTYDNAKVGDMLDLYSPVYNTGNADTVRLSFSRAAADYNGNGATTDTLQVLLTTDCGETFTTIFSKTGADLTTSPVTDFFYPTSVDEWKADTIDVSNLVRNAASYRFVFRVINSFNNNVFLDNVQLQTKQAGVLAVKLTSFTGYRKGVANELQWKAGTTSATTFTVQRSANGRDFESIGDVNAPAGTTEKTFSLTDINLQAYKYYYRLQIKEADGQLTYSNIIVLVSNKDGLEITGFYPSPLKGNTGYLNITSGKSQKLQVMVTDIAGKKISTQAINIIAGSNNISLTFGKLAAGTYLLRVMDEKNGSHTIRFMKD